MKTKKTEEEMTQSSLTDYATEGGNSRAEAPETENAVTSSVPPPVTPYPAMSPESVPALTPEDQFLMESAKDEDDTLTYFPRLQIEQKGKEHTIGSLFSDEIGSEFENIKVVLLRKQNSRLMWPEEFNTDNLPLCRSHDGLVPAGDIIISDEDADEVEYASVMADKCSDCPYAKWGKGKKAPTCKEVYDLLLLDIETYIPMWFSVYSTALSPTNKKLLQPLKLRRMSLSAQRSRLGLPGAHTCMFSFVISTELKENPKGDAYIPNYTSIEELSDDDKAVMIKIAMMTKDATPYSSQDSPNGEDAEEAEAGAEDF